MEVNATSGGAKDHPLNYHQMPENNEEAAQQHSNEEEEGKKEGGKKTWGDMAKGMKTFIWNPEKRQFMGRTAHSWGLILLFYLVLYLFLAGMFAFCMYMMLMTLSPYTPKYRDRVAPPGVMIRPHVSNSINLGFKPNDANSWQIYVDNLHEFLQDYDDKVQEHKNIQCNEGNYFIQDGEESGLRKACQFKRSALNACSGIDDPSFGYSTGQPCILLKMNRFQMVTKGTRRKQLENIQNIREKAHPLFYCLGDNSWFARQTMEYFMCEPRQCITAVYPPVLCRPAGTI